MWRMTGKFVLGRPSKIGRTMRVSRKLPKRGDLISAKADLIHSGNALESRVFMRFADTDSGFKLISLSVRRVGIVLRKRPIAGAVCG